MNAGAFALPLYRDVIGDIMRHIDAGTLAPGERLGTLAELCVRYGVSQMTVRTALRELATVGYIESRRRGGIFVRERRQVPENGNVLGFVATRVEDPFFQEILAGARGAAEADNLTLIVTDSENDPVAETLAIRRLASEVGGLIIAPNIHQPNYAAYLPLLEKSITFVFIDRYVEKLAVPVIATDNEYGGYIATSHILDCGVERVFMLNEHGTSSSQERLRGFRRALAERGIAFDPADVYICQASSVSARAQTATILASRPAGRIGIFCITESLAAGCYDALGAAGLRMPDDVVVVGYDDARAGTMSPPLSTVRQPLRELGATAVRVLVDSIRNGADRTRSVRLIPELVVRRSSQGS